MNILYCHDNFYMPAKDGKIYSAGQFPYEYFSPFLRVFDTMTVIGRRLELSDNKDPRFLNLSSGDNISFALYPNMNSPIGLLKYYWKIWKSLKEQVKKADAVIIRAVSDMGWIVFQHARLLGKPIAMEMTACAWDSTWNHGSTYAKLYAPVRYIHDRIIAHYADYVMYITQHFLPNRYPTNAEVEFVSNVRIKRRSNDILDQRLSKIKKLHDEDVPCVIGLIGTLSHNLKGVKDALYAIAKIQELSTKNYTFRVLGPGDTKPYVRLAEKLGISNQVRFDGMLQTGDLVMDWLDEIDLYIQPSYQEGVPRATIEAMSRGCPAIGSTAGGIPELLPSQWLHKPGDIKRLANLIQTMAENVDLQIMNANVNFKTSSSYCTEILMPKRIKFWKDFAEFVKTQR